MKKMHTPVFLIAALILSSCSNSDPKPAPKPEESVSQIVEEVAPVVTLKAYKHTGLDFDSDGFCLNGGVAEKEQILEVKKIEAGKPINCGEGEYIQKIKVEGKLDGVIIVFFDKKGKEIFRSNPSQYIDNAAFSTINHKSDGSGLDTQEKDGDFKGWFETAAKIQILFKDKMINELSWNSNGWLRQSGGVD